MSSKEGTLANDKQMRSAAAGRPDADPRIVFDADICGGRARIRGTRVRVSDIVGAIAEGDTVDDLVAEFPYLTAEDIAAALRYAAGAVDHRVVIAA